MAKKQMNFNQSFLKTVDKKILLKEIRSLRIINVPVKLTNLTINKQFNWFNELDHVLSANTFAYSQQNRCIGLAIYID